MLNWIWTRRPLPCRAARPKSLHLEALEDRMVPSAVTVYTETNNPAAGQNAVLAYRSNPVTGNLTLIGSFSTGGTGELNLPKVVGPDDGDHQVVASRDGRFLYAVNEGSNSITAFRIDPNGRLDRIGTVDSGGIEPDGLSVAGNQVYVANRGDATQTQPGTVAPNVTGFNVGRDGRLSLIAGSTVSFPVGTFATQVLVTANDRLLFVQLASLSGAPEGNTVQPFQIQGDGTLVASPGGGVGQPINPSVQLGLAFNPHLNIIYAGLTGNGQVGVYTYDETGRISFVSAASDQGSAPCWITVSGDGRTLYASNTGTDSVGVYSLANPLQPVEIQEFSLGGPHGPAGGPTQTADFELALSPNGRTLYVIGQNTSPTASFPQGNQLHILSVARDGTLSEPAGPIIFPTSLVPADAHPQGLAVVGGTTNGHGFFDWDFDDRD